GWRGDHHATRAPARTVHRGAHPRAPAARRDGGRIHAAGGIAVAPHTMAPLTPSVGGGSMRQLQRDTDAGRHLDAIELMNPSAAGRARHHARRRLNAELLHLPGIGSSDAHVVEGIGTAWTWFPGASAEDFRAALASWELEPAG